MLDDKCVKASEAFTFHSDEGGHVMGAALVLGCRMHLKGMNEQTVAKRGTHPIVVGVKCVCMMTPTLSHGEQHTKNEKNLAPLLVK